MNMDQPKFLYHGTSSSLLPTILTEGIKPRGKNPSLWKIFPSRPDCTYLTSAYPFFFAQQAVNQMGDGKICVLEINVEMLSPRVLLPDEDFLTQASEKGVPGLDPHPLEWFRTNLEKFNEYWLPSILLLGNCAHKGVIPPWAITRTCVVGESRDSLLMKVSDPSISLMNFSILGDYYRELVRWFFSDRPDLPDQWYSKISSKGNTKIDEMYITNQNYLKKLGADRTDIKVDVVRRK